MRNIYIAAAMAVGTMTAVLATPAMAVDYPYCLQGDRFGVPGDCSYRSFAQCKATASGQRGDCNINPRFAFARCGRQDFDGRNDGRARAGSRAYREDVNQGYDYPRY